jgi:hypothetical protein
MAGSCQRVYPTSRHFEVNVTTPFLAYPEADLLVATLDEVLASAG